MRCPICGAKRDFILQEEYAFPTGNEIWHIQRWKCPECSYYYDIVRKEPLGKGQKERDPKEKRLQILESALFGGDLHASL